jgi:hypothetical protein
MTKDPRDPYQMEINLETLADYVIEMVHKAEVAKHADGVDFVERRYQQGRADALRSILPYLTDYASTPYRRHRGE